MSETESFIPQRERPKIESIEQKLRNLNEAKIALFDRSIQLIEAQQEFIKRLRLLRTNSEQSKLDKNLQEQVTKALEEVRIENLKVQEDTRLIQDAIEVFSDIQYNPFAGQEVGEV